MHERSLLGAADVTDEELRGIVAALLGSDAARTEVLCSRAVEVDYDVPAITTAGRFWVGGQAAVDGLPVPWQLFVKHVQSWDRSPLFAAVPAELREMAARSVPWRTEALIYRSELADRLPGGLRMARCLAVRDLDERSAAVWLEPVPTVEAVWDLPRYARAAHLVGRMAASSRVAPLADIGGLDWRLDRDYVGGRLMAQVLPSLRSDELWTHPLVATSFGHLRDRLLAVADRVDEMARELLTYPVLTSHGDACPNNLLVTDDDGFVLIDFGFWMPQPLGFDLGQLLVGELQMGRMRAEDLAAVDATIVAAYAEGVRDECVAVTDGDLRRAHALHLALFNGLSALPLEHLSEDPTPALATIFAERAGLAEFSLQLLEPAGP